MTLRKPLVGALLFAMFGAAVFADTGDKEPSAAVVSGSVGVKLTPQEMTAKADQLMDEMEQAQRRVTELQLVARNAKDIIKLNCVNDKLLQVKQLLNLAEDARANVYAAGDDREHAFAEITLANEKVVGLRGEAEGCVGDGEIFVGATRVSVQKPEILDDPTTVDPFRLTGFTIERPTYATPYL